MAKLYLKFESSVLKEVPVGQKGVVTIGRLPDNVLQVDNLAVSGHHCKIYWEADHYVIEDNSSLNGTYVNNQRVTKQVLKDNDSVLVGKHVVIFRDEWHEEEAASKFQAQMPSLPKMEATVVLDTKKAKELMAQARAQHAASTGAAPEPPAAPAGAEVPAAKPTASMPTMPPTPTGTLTVLSGKTDEQHYLLNSKLTVIGGSKMATVKLKGGLFHSPPDVAAMISKGETAYFIAPQDRKSRLKVNGVDVSHRQELKEGDVIEVAGVKMNFAFQQ